jgi:hypothetical protein
MLPVLRFIEYKIQMLQVLCLTEYRWRQYYVWLNTLFMVSITFDWLPFLWSVLRLIDYPFHDQYCVWLTTPVMFSITFDWLPFSWSVLCLIDYPFHGQYYVWLTTLFMVSILVKGYRLLSSTSLLLVTIALFITVCIWLLNTRFQRVST